MPKKEEYTDTCLFIGLVICLELVMLFMEIEKQYKICMNWRLRLTRRLSNARIKRKILFLSCMIPFFSYCLVYCVQRIWFTESTRSRGGGGICYSSSEYVSHWFICGAWSRVQPEEKLIFCFEKVNLIADVIHSFTFTSIIYIIYVLFWAGSVASLKKETCAHILKLIYELPMRVCSGS